MGLEADVCHSSGEVRQRVRNQDHQLAISNNSHLLLKLLLRECLILVHLVIFRNVGGASDTFLLYLSIFKGLNSWFHDFTSY